MSWIRTIPFAKATGRLLRLYERVTGPDQNVDNIMMAHSLRPHTMEGHMALYKTVLHHSSNQLPKAYLEIVGVWVSILNNCAYCVQHHFAGLARLMDDAVQAYDIRQALEARYLSAAPISSKERAGLIYAEQLTMTPDGVTEDAIAALRSAGFDDGEILELNQVTAYFAYANRTVLGLGVTTDGDILGLSPNNSTDETDWSHS